METILEKYKEKIKLLKRDDIDRDTILVKTFLIEETSSMQIYYAPHNEYLNKGAKLLIVGICPGWSQTKIAYQTVKEGLDQNLSDGEILRNCKLSARFAGSMRNNIVEMLDELELNERYQVSSICQLFDTDDLLHTTSLIPYPVFIKGKNYTGYGPSILKSKELMNYVRSHFYKEIESLNHVLIVPLGKAVEEVLYAMVEAGLVTKQQCLFGFPHPSGANAHRKKQFLENKEDLKKQIDRFFDYDKG